MGKGAGGAGGGGGVTFGGGAGGAALATALGGTVANMTGVSAQGNDLVVSSGAGNIRLNPTQQRAFETSNRNLSPRTSMTISQPGSNRFITVSPAQRRAIINARNRRLRAQTGRAGGTAPKE